MGNIIHGFPGFQYITNSDSGPPPTKKRKLEDGSSSIGGSMYEKDLEIHHLNSEIKRLKESCVSIEDYEDMKHKYLIEKNAKDDALRRLSAIASSKLRNNNPNIADLSDANRPTKIAEKLSELYDNQWTDAFGDLEKGMNERDIIHFLRDILMKSYAECKAISSDNYFEKIQRCIECPLQFAGSGQLKTGSVLPDYLKHQIKEFRKFRAMHVVKDIEKAIKGKLNTHSKMSAGVDRYISSCVEITWLMVVQDPPLVLSATSSSKFDSKIFREYTKRGPNIDYVVWPALFLHEGGPLLVKGVAQGCVQHHRYR